MPTAFTPNLEAMANRQNQLAQQQLVQQLLSNSQNVQTSLLQQQQQQTLAAVSTERKVFRLSIVA